jgi:hypothetical protein
MTARMPVDRMYCDSIYAGSVDFDWTDSSRDEEGEPAWEQILPDPSSLTVEQCKSVLDDQGIDLPSPNPWKMDRQQLFDFLNESNDEASLGDETQQELLLLVVAAMNDEEIDGLDYYRDAVRSHYEDDGRDRFTPMMNYYYPLPDYNGDESDDQLLLDREGGSVALVRVGDKVVLALTGGGMDLSRDICEGFMLLGYLPPLKYCDIPHFGGDKLTARLAWIISGCVRSCEVAVSQAAHTKERLEQYRDSLPKAESS